MSSLVHLISHRLLMCRSRCNSYSGSRAVSSHLIALVHLTTRGAKRHIIVLISRCSGPVLRTVKESRLRRRCQGALGTFCNILGSVSNCVGFTVLANIAGFNGIDMFDSLGGLSSVSVHRVCISLYNVDRRRLRSGLRDRLRRLTSTRKMACSRVYGGLHSCCSNCRFACGSVNVCGPFDLLGTFGCRRFNDC